MRPLTLRIERTPGRDGFGDHLVRTGRETPLPITFLFVPEEEVGNPTSRAAIEAAARANRYVLVTEPARDDGRIVHCPQGPGDVRDEGDGTSVARGGTAPGRPERDQGGGPPGPATRGHDRLRAGRHRQRRDDLGTVGAADGVSATRHLRSIPAPDGSAAGGVLRGRLRPVRRRWRRRTPHRSDRRGAMSGRARGQCGASPYPSRESWPEGLRTWRD